MQEATLQIYLHSFQVNLFDIEITKHKLFLLLKLTLIIFKCKIYLWNNFSREILELGKAYFCITLVVLVLTIDKLISA